MASKMIILVLLAVAVAADLKKGDKSSGEAKKGKRGLFDLGYGSIDSGFSSYYSTYPEISAVSTVITKEHPLLVEKHVALPIKVPYAVRIERPYPIFHTYEGLKTSSW